MNPVIDHKRTKKWYNNLGQYHREDGPAYEGSDGTQTWWLSGQCHREDGPAVIGSDGTQEWWLNGLRHRIDSPAVIGPNGYRSWWLNGERHREDGPAIMHNDTQIWLLNGKELSEEFFLKLTQGPKEDLPVYLGLGFDGYIAEKLSS